MFNPVVLDTGRDTGSENIPREEEVGEEERIRGRVRNFKEARTQESRSETKRLVNEMSGKIKAILLQNQSLISEEIDTDEEWGPVGRIPEEKMKLGSSRRQEEVGKAMMEPTENP